MVVFDVHVEHSMADHDFGGEERLDEEPKVQTLGVCRSTRGKAKV